jgi:protease-4
MLQASTERVYEQFINQVAEHRGRSPEDIEAVAKGRVWSGAQAQERGLVDQLGSLDAAVDAAARMAGLGSDYRAGYFQRTLPPFEAFLAELTGGVVAHLPLASATPALAPRGFVADLLADLRSIADGDGRFQVAAHCLCEVR